jgi:hypothetical protein
MVRSIDVILGGNLCSVGRYSTGNIRRRAASLENASVLICVYFGRISTTARFNEWNLSAKISAALIDKLLRLCGGQRELSDRSLEKV